MRTAFLKSRSKAEKLLLGLLGVTVALGVYSHFYGAHKPYDTSKVELKPASSQMVYRAQAERLGIDVADLQDFRLARLDCATELNERGLTMDSIAFIRPPSLTNGKIIYTVDTAVDVPITCVYDPKIKYTRVDL